MYLNEILFFHTQQQQGKQFMFMGNNNVHIEQTSANYYVANYEDM